MGCKSLATVLDFHLADSCLCPVTDRTCKANMIHAWHARHAAFVLARSCPLHMFAWVQLEIVCVMLRMLWLQYEFDLDLCNVRILKLGL